MGVTREPQLRQAIMEVLPFDVDDAKAKKVLAVILKHIVHGLHTSDRVTIKGVGRFYRVWKKPKLQAVPRNKFTKTVPYIEYVNVDGKYKVYFRPCNKLLMELRD